MYVEKGKKASESQGRDKKPKQKGKKSGLTEAEIERRLKLPIDDKEKLFQGVFMNNEARRNKGGRIRCKDLPNKIDVQARMINETLHQCVVYWSILKRVPPMKKEDKGKETGKSEDKKNIGENDKKDTTQKADTTEKVEKVEENPKQVEKKTESQEIKEKPVEQKPKEQEAKLQSQEDSEEDEKPKRKRSREIVQPKEQPKAQHHDSDSDDQKVQLDKIIAKIVKIKEDPWTNGRPIVCTLKLIQRRNVMDLPRDPTPMEVIQCDYYIDADPINKRLPMFEVYDLKKVQKDVFAEAKKLYENSKNKQGGKGNKQLRNENTKETRQYLKDVIENYYFVMKLKRWSRNDPYPEGIVTTLLKKVKTPEGQCEALLHDLELSGYGHKQGQEIKLQIGPQHKKYDHLIAFTIDPETSVDLDDALSIVELEKGLYQVGIHISDVTSYLKFLDRKHIAELSTSVYLPYEVKHMLPRNFVEICTLAPHVDRLAFTVFLKMNENGEVFDERYEKTIINSRCQLSYEIAQEVIEGKIKQPKDFPERLKLSDKDAEQVIKSIHALNRVAQGRRNKRVILDVFNKHEIKFELDKDNYPVSISLYVRKQAHKVIEQFMILGNEFVAKKLCRDFGGDSLVIHHPKPSELNQQYFNKFFKEYGINVHFNSMKELQTQIKTLIEKGLPKEVEELLILKASRSQQSAQYSLNKDNEQLKQHFALNLSAYTHFTSPMRRFADVIAHEQLFRCLQNKHYDQEGQKTLQSEVDQLNKRRQATKRLKQQINDSFFCLLIDNTNKTIKTKGILTSFGIQSVSIFIPEYDMIREIFWKKELEVRWLEYDKDDRNVMIVEFEDGKKRQKLKWRAQKHSTIQIEMDCTYTAPLRMLFHFFVEIGGKQYKIRGRR